MQPQIDQMTGMPIADPQQQLQQMPANMQGGRRQNFITESQQMSGEQIFGGQSLPQRKAVGAAGMGENPMLPSTPLAMADQTGDGKITQADVIKARVEGYKDSPAKMHKGKPHPGEYFIAEPKDNTPPPKTRQEKKNIIMGEFRDVMRKRNDSLKKLPIKNINHLPTFNGDLDAKVDWYKDPKNKPKINRLNKLSKPLRDKVRVDLKNV